MKEATRVRGRGRGTFVGGTWKPRCDLTPLRVFLQDGEKEPQKRRISEPNGTSTLDVEKKQRKFVEVSRKCSSLVVEQSDRSANSALEKSQPVTDCICERPETIVTCVVCGTTFRGHAVRICNEHPRRINLMDVRLCPNASCRSDRLLEAENRMSHLPEG